MPAKYRRKLSGVLRSLGACYERNNWTGLTFRDALPLMSWGNFGWLVDRLQIPRAARKIAPASKERTRDIEFLKGVQYALNSLKVNDGSELGRYLTDAEKERFVRNKSAITRRLQSLLRVR